jgi:hypothetical protein
VPGSRKKLRGGLQSFGTIRATFDRATYSSAQVEGKISLKVLLRSSKRMKVEAIQNLLSETGTA